MKFKGQEKPFFILKEKCMVVSNQYYPKFKWRCV